MSVTTFNCFILRQGKRLYRITHAWFLDVKKISKRLFKKNKKKP